MIRNSNDDDEAVSKEKDVGRADVLTARLSFLVGPSGDPSASGVESTVEASKAPRRLQCLSFLDDFQKPAA